MVFLDHQAARKATFIQKVIQKQQDLKLRDERKSNHLNDAQIK